MPLEGSESRVEMREVVHTAPDLGTLPGNEVTQLDRHLLAVACGAENGELTGSIEREVERAKPDQEPESLLVGRRVLAVAVRSTRWRRQQTGGLVVAGGPHGRARAAGNVSDPHAPNRRPSSDWNVKRRPRSPSEHSRDPEQADSAGQAQAKEDGRQDPQERGTPAGVGEWPEQCAVAR